MENSLINILLPLSLNFVKVSPDLVGKNFNFSLSWIEFQRLPVYLETHPHVSLNIVFQPQIVGSSHDRPQNEIVAFCSPAKECFQGLFFYKYGLSMW